MDHSTNKLRTYIVRILDPLVKRRDLDAVDRPIAILHGRLGNVKLAVHPQSDGSMATMFRTVSYTNTTLLRKCVPCCASHRPRKHRVKTIQPNNTQKVAAAATTSDLGAELPVANWAEVTPLNQALVHRHNILRPRLHFDICAVGTRSCRQNEMHPQVSKNILAYLERKSKLTSADGFDTGFYRHRNALDVTRHNGQRNTQPYRCLGNEKTDRLNDVPDQAKSGVQEAECTNTCSKRPVNTGLMTRQAPYLWSSNPTPPKVWHWGRPGWNAPCVRHPA